jgi:hypothetical protein
MKLIKAKIKKQKKKQPDYLEAMGNQVAGKIFSDKGMAGKIPFYGRFANKDQAS